MTTLSNALSASLSSLKTVQESISVAANNVANVNTPGYVRQTVNQQSIVTDGVGQGVQVVSITANVDEQLLKSLRAQFSELGYANALNGYYDTAQTLLGKPSDDNSLSSSIDKFLADFQILSDTPQTASLQLAAVNSAVDLTNKISQTARDLHNLQVSADAQIKAEVNQVNSIILSLHDTNVQIINFPEGTAGRLEIEQEREVLLRQLSEYVNVSANVNSDGKLTVLTGSGLSLLETSGPYQLSHIAVPSRDNFVNGTPRSAITISPLNNNGTLGEPVDLVTSGIGSSVTTSLTSGSIKGLVEIRELELPKIIEQLDNLALELTKQVNAITNNGSSFPPPSSLTGTTSIASTTSVGFSGSVMIAVLDSDGTPPTSPYSDEVNLRPLTLDLGSLDSGSGAGQPDLQTIVDEINYYYGPPQPRAEVGNLRDITLAAVSTDIADGGTAQFDLQLDNISTENATVVINSITVIDPIDFSQTYNAATLPSPNSYVVNPGDRERTGIPFTVDFGGDDNRASYTVRVQVQVTDASGNVSVADIDYTVNDNVTAVKNDRYPPAAVTNVSGTSTLHAAPSSQGFLTASIVDANGVTVSAGTSGFLKLTTNPNSSYGVVMSELNSQEVGLPSTPSSSVTNKGFSDYFGMNNFFEPHGTTGGSALNMSVRSDIVSNPSKLQRASLILSNQPSDPNTAVYTYEIGSGDNAILSSIASLNDVDVSFASAGTLPNITTTLTGYSADIIGYTSTISVRFYNVQQIEALGLEGLNDLLFKQAGVNTDDELARIIELENNYKASAQIISTIQELFRALQQAF
ncbi:MAG: flagellar hook-associated protein FlgK [Rickettsiales bacterium]|nr:flagellar hook-associated protein FlgK [Pseudomonadota bacterium]MDA0966793.1 flagellar hook-associated protein FlgK [Pseudomonadota bacterium]MDG4543465.1 flagellar hook-associated protein FlgK [Rickettsiales bacterium]MDG4546141.1 flagellar hook-associated protein FlgK [Rickettsiales bacterium]MDG4547614.1 flagellar hook-associated protein FlgK [Rickettsiales bacterium]